MSRQEATDQYLKALKSGQRYRKDCVVRGRYPYPQVLDDILDDSMVAGQMDLGLVEIPSEQIVGTKAQGRKPAFAANFMPLLPINSEFGAKWVSLCMAHLGDEGIREPIKCYEYLGRFYVQEGNKRVSVLKSYDAPTIPGYVIRVIPAYSQDPAIQVYYEFMQFYQLSGLYQVYFTTRGSFAKLQAALGYEPDHVWTAAERQRFLSGFSFFKEAFVKLGGNNLQVTPAGALLVWLRVYSFDDLKTQSSSELLKNLTAIWSDIKVLDKPAPIAVSTAPKEEPDKSLLTRIFGSSRLSHLNVAFIYDHSPVDSAWAASHDKGRQYLEETLADKVSVQVYSLSNTNTDAVALMETAIQEGAQVIFSITPQLITACRKVAVKHPDVRVLNCSISMPYTGIRTYYSRVYEGKFITGAIAGALAKEDRIGYLANYPIFGVPASINAFALGAQLTNPRARIQLHWSCTPGNALDVFTRQGITIISSRDTPAPDMAHPHWGVYQVQPDGSLKSLAFPFWHWGKFYEKIILSILRGGWDTLDVDDTEKAVNYWWGMSSGVIDVHLADTLPDGVQHLAGILRKGMIEEAIDPFLRPIRSQDGTIRNDGTKWFGPEEILHMDWLCDNVDGKIPTYDQLLPMSQPMVRLLGVYRNSIPPEKGETPL